MRQLRLEKLLIDRLKVGIWAWMGRRRSDEWLYRQRAQLALLIGATVFVLIVVTAATIAGWRWPDGWFSSLGITVVIEVQALLAVGTLALAFAALVSAVAGLDAVRRRYRPSLTLVALPLEYKQLGVQYDRTPRLVGPRLAVRNAGPGVAKNARVRWFAYPETPEAKSYLAALKLDVPVTERSGEYKSLLTVGEEDQWLPTIAERFPVDMDYIIELPSDNVFDEPVHVPRYHVRRIRSKSPADGSAPSVSWQIFDAPGGVPESVPSIEDMVKRGAAYGAPALWDLTSVKQDSAKPP